MLLMSSSPGGRGGSNVLSEATNYFPYMGANISATFSLPKFYDNFKEGTGITENQLKQDFEAALNKFEASI